MVQRALLDTRLAVRRALAEWRAADLAGDGSAGAAPLVLVALSGGPDSLALAAATAHEAGRAGLRAGALVIDHGLQEGSAGVADRAAHQAEQLGLAPVMVDRVRVEDGGGGPEANARSARYEAFARAAERTGAAAILTAHTRDDQAEQVLLALARGSGSRSLAGIPPRRRLAETSSGTAILRPFLASPPEITRATTESACAEAGLDPWRDPHNHDAAFARVRVRERVLPLLVRELGPGVPAALARTADLAREDADALDGIAEGIAAAALAEPGPQPAASDRAALMVADLAPLPAALLARVIRLVADRRFGAQLSREHTAAVAALVADWHGQGPVYAPGVRVSRAGSQLEFVRQTGSPRAPR
ncbi:tRNA lysidine(34) synthetase TilS [Leucobacter chironomi]|uniref:tRNA lysidine(34) synthetase TilS n=1 Tax=Leucobacter chironomi TaxID=491918 RepID=UPI00041554B4|nr:tRNA lysidine(34) synthetase TilS [Leucobacter chironomi]